MAGRLRYRAHALHEVMLNRNEKGRGLVKAVDGLNLQDLANASDGQIKAVTDLVWEIKGLFHALIKEKASDVLGDLNIGDGAKLSAALITDLTAGIPRDAVITAQQEWLPNLATEMAAGPVTPPEIPAGSNVVQAVPIPSPQEPQSAATVETEPADTEPAAAEEIVCADEPPRAEDIAPPDGEPPETEAAEPEPEEQILAEIKGRLPLPDGTPRAIKARTENAKKKNLPEEAEVKTEDEKVVPCADQQPPAEAGGQPEVAAGETQVAEAKAADESPADKATDQFDDLLFPEGAGNAGQTEDADAASKVEDTAPVEASPATTTASVDPQTVVAPVTGIESDVDPETWAEYGGWYRQDYTIYYRPTGHKDKFIQSWLAARPARKRPRAARVRRRRSSIISPARTRRAHAQNATALTISGARRGWSISPRFQSRANRGASRISSTSRIWASWTIAAA